MNANNFTAVKVVLGGAVATNGTFTVPYPDGKGLADYENAVGHYFLALGAKFTQPDDFTIAFTTLATITYKGATTLPQGTEIYVQLEEVGRAKPKAGYVNDGATKVSITKLRELELLQIDLGAPITADPNGYVESQDLTALGVFSVSTTVAAALAAAALDGVADVPRNVVAAWTGTAVLTVTGTDEYDQVIVESSASGTSLTGKKAFKTITNITASANITSLTVGTGDVLGIPVWLPSGGYIISELEDGAAVGTAGTLVAGLAPNTISTATTADVRGTYDPNSACDGAKSFSLIAVLPDPTHLGNDQYAG
jgi:hypothetical protein